MGGGISDLIARGEASDDECEAAVLYAIRASGCITWWPGGRHHSAIVRLKNRGVVQLTDVSGSQETKFEVRLAEPPAGES